jgi:hypothetical protein
MPKISTNPLSKYFKAVKKLTIKESRLKNARAVVFKWKHKNDTSGYKITSAI